MLRLGLGDLYDVAATLAARHTQAMVERDTSFEFKSDTANKTSASMFRGVLSEAWKHCSAQGFAETAASAQRNLTYFENREPSPEARVVALYNLSNVFARELQRQCCVQLVPGREKYLDQRALFGDRVETAFPSAFKDIQAAGNSLAVELHTATVFHLMRAAEVGLRALAYDRRVVLKRRSQVLPMDLATWDKILEGLEKSEAAIEQFPKTATREAQLAFYHGAMIQLRAFKNLFRNRVMHKREDYDVHQAEGAMEHVGEFLRTLATRITEKTRTPRRWTSGLLKP
jgi:hypothetical protein